MMTILGVVSDCHDELQTAIDNFVPKGIKADTEVMRQEINAIHFRNAKKVFSIARKLEDFTEVLSLELEKIKVIFEIEDRIKAAIATKLKPSLPAPTAQKKDLIRNLA